MSRTCKSCDRTFSDRGYGIHYTRIHTGKFPSGAPKPSAVKAPPLDKDVSLGMPTPLIRLVFAVKMISSLVKDKSVNPVTRHVRLYFELLDDALEAFK